jgi:acyl-CoA thioesterase FadM
MVLMSRHVNNVRYVRWIETARIRYAESLELPGGQVRGMLVSLNPDYSTLNTTNLTWDQKVLSKARRRDEREKGEKERSKWA